MKTTEYKIQKNVIFLFKSLVYVFFKRFINVSASW